MPVADLRRLRGVSKKRDVADNLASDVTPETVFAQWRDAGSVSEISFVPDADVIANGANYATIQVFKRTGSGAPVLLGSADSHALGWTSGVPVAIPTAGTIASGDVLSWSISKTGTGVIVPTGELFVQLTPNFVDTAIADRTEEIYDSLAKRYTVPFAAPVPSIVKRWCSALVDRDCFGKRGAQPSNTAEDEEIDKAADLALAQIKEAADSKDGLYDLPVRADSPGTSGIVGAAPMGQADVGPYDWIDDQADAIGSVS